jgi:CRISPR-associated protein (TIGR03984 family)
LYRHRADGLPLDAALAAYGKAVEGPAVALLYTPQRCLFAVPAADGKLLDARGGELPLAAVYEARVFGEAAELRWWNDPSPHARHRAVILCEADLAQKLGAGWETKPARIVGTIAQTYLLWGEGTGRSDGGWSELAAARIGTLEVPCAGVAERKRVLLNSVEYLGPGEEHLGHNGAHGNVTVVDERLVRLEVDRGE